MDLYLILRLVHILGAAVLFGTGLGIAFFMFMADRDGNPALIAGTARIVVVADFLFTATAVVTQPLSGIGLAFLTGRDIWESWIVASLGLYLLVGLFWLPVVWLQLEMKKMAEEAALTGTALSPRYRHFARIWFWCGWPAFISVLAIFCLMIAKPVLW
ncbi:MAG: hypothetical protein AMXMBFR74_13440 [Parvibaculum sp.]|uniref:DUF2269 family protein n=1 Tax=Parvibaculum sp. TaxID=2024848 RepID=UPI0035B9DC59